MVSEVNERIHVANEAMDGVFVEKVRGLERHAEISPELLIGGAYLVSRPDQAHHGFGAE
jgi:hypothetical protein